MAPLLQPSSASLLRPAELADYRQAWRIEDVEGKELCWVWAQARDVADALSQMTRIRRGFPVIGRRSECHVVLDAGHTSALVMYLIAEGYDVIPGSN